jgi:hypothetical protein
MNTFFGCNLLKKYKITTISPKYREDYRWTIYITGTPYYHTLLPKGLISIVNFKELIIILYNKRRPTDFGIQWGVNHARTWQQRLRPWSEWPTCRKFGRITQQGPEESTTELGPEFPKGAEFEPVLVSLIFSYQYIEKHDFLQIFSLKWLRKPEKNLKGPKFFTRQNFMLPWQHSTAMAYTLNLQ